MWLTSKQAIILAVIGVTMGGVTTASAQFRAQPPIVRFVGVFQPFDQKAAGNLNTPRSKKVFFNSVSPS